MALPTVSGEFTAIADPELRFAPSGTAVGTIRLAANSRKFNKQTQEWEDGDSLFIDGVLFNQQAENMVESVTKGMRLIVEGRIRTEQWEKDGEKRSAIRMTIDRIGPSLSFATARVTKTERSGGGGGAPQQQQGQQQTQQQADPWSQPQGDEPPF